MPTVALASMPLPHTMLYVALLGVLLVVLTYHVLRKRVAITVNPASADSDTVERVSRVHGNFIEYVPIALILLAVLELNRAPVGLVHGLGILLLVSRMLHAWGMTRHPMISFGRIIGIQGTLLMILIGTIAALWLYVKGYP